MGQAGAQREPSMEEILASIRRIIENNEPALDGSHMESGDPDAHHLDGDGSYAGDHQADDHEASQGHGEEPMEVVADEPVSRPVSLAEVAALARAIPKHSDSRTDEPAPAKPVPSNDVSDTVEIDNAAAEELRDALMSNDPVVAPVPVETASTVAQEPEQFGQKATSMTSVNHDPSDELKPSSGQLVSLHTGEKVAAAFGELDAAIAAGQSRSFDEIAEEMLRPMLTQWLDDNLPTLVERLVREEIERVSRGNRR